jgi:hypothetical protein
VLRRSEDLGGEAVLDKLLAAHDDDVTADLLGSRSGRSTLVLDAEDAGWGFHTRRPAATVPTCSSGPLRPVTAKQTPLPTSRPGPAAMCWILPVCLPACQ